MPSDRNTRYVRVGGHLLKLTHLDRVIYPQARFTKLGVIRYYREVAQVILPYLLGRAITFHRFPMGVDAESFYEKRCPFHRPAFMKTAKPEPESELDQCLIEDEASLLWVANLASIEIHSPLATVYDSKHPSYVLFDLDPGPGATFMDCARVAVEIRRLLDRMELEAFPKTSGKKGLHVYVPLHSGTDYEASSTFAREVAITLERNMPDDVVSRMAKKLRGGKIFIDWSQNTSHKTTITAYSLRAWPQPTISAPLLWSEVESASKRASAAEKYGTILWNEGLDRLDRLGDVFEGVRRISQALPKRLARAA